MGFSRARVVLGLLGCRQAHSHRGAGGKNKTATPLPSCLEEPVKKGQVIDEHPAPPFRLIDGLGEDLLKERNQ